MNDIDSQEPLSTLSEGSFVILGQGSLPDQINDDLNQVPNTDMFSSNRTLYNGFKSTNSNKSDDFSSKLWSGSSLSEEQIQKKLDELIKENTQLKETLSQNNLAIKSQLDTFIMWQQQVLKTHETHKQKFLETKDLILKLRAENACLKKQVEESSLGVPAVSESEVYAQVKKVPEDVDKLKKKIEDYKLECFNLSLKNENLDSENQELKEELKAAKNEILKLNKELEDIGRENIFLKQQNKNSFESVSYKSLPSSEARVQISNLFEQLEHEKEKVLKLKKELEKSKSSDSEMISSKLSTTEKLNQYIDKLNNMNNSFNMQSQRYSSLSSWVSLAEQNLKETNIGEGIETNLVSEINQLKTHLNEEENVFKEKQESLLDLRKQFHKLLEDYKSLQAKLISLKNIESSNEKHKEDLSSLLTKLQAKDEELLLKQQECEQLKKNLEKMNLECEEIQVLRAQVQIYQTDFNDERAAREKLAGEKEEMAERIRLLESIIKALEGENLKKETTPIEPHKKETTFTCPNCLYKFPYLKELEDHVEECCNDTLF